MSQHGLCQGSYQAVVQGMIFQGWVTWRSLGGGLGSLCPAFPPALEVCHLSEPELQRGM